MKKKSRLQVISTNLGTFDNDVTCLVGPFKEAVKFVSKAYNMCPTDVYEDVDHPPLGIHFHTDYHESIIWIPRKPKNPTEISTFAHECLHASLRMMRWAGIKVTYDTEECVTHVMGFLIKTFLRKMK